MRVHRGEYTRSYVVLPNHVAQDRRLSFTARGLLADLLSRPDGWREDYRMMADSSPQGRTAVSRALRELREAGYYRIERMRQDDGTFLTVTHIHDAPYSGESMPPNTVNPGSGRRASDSSGRNPVKDVGKVPSLPSQYGSGDVPQAAQRAGRTDDSSATNVQTRPVDASDPETRDAVAALYRVIRPEPRLRLGAVEALELAPMVAAWLGRASERDLAEALLPGLPPRVYNPLKLLRIRLTRKMPPVSRACSDVGAASGVRFGDCPACRDPLGPSGVCRPCAGLGERRESDSRLDQTTNVRGRALARAAALGLVSGPALAFG